MKRTKTYLGDNLKVGSQKVSEGIIVRIDSDGTETVVAVTRKEDKNLMFEFISVPLK